MITSYVIDFVLYGRDEAKLIYIISDKTDIRLGCLNICLGSNSVGKSSVLQSIIIMRQIAEKTLRIRIC